MHIGFDISQTGEDKAGCGYFAHSLIQHMLMLAPEHDYSLFPSFGDFYFNYNMPIINPYPGEQVHYGPRYFRREAVTAFWTDPNLETAIGAPEIVHANNFWCPLGLKTSRLVYTFYDMGFVVEPSWTTESNHFGCFEGIFRAALTADWIVAISEASRTHYLKLFPYFPEDRIRVIYPSSRFLDLSAEGTKPHALQDIPAGGYWLSVGTIEPRKNQRRLAEAYARYLTLGNTSMKLVLAGKDGWLMDDFQAYLNVLGIADKVVITGYISDDELIWLYRHCFANLYPSFFEGFGLPVLEGMQFGAPTIASHVTSIPEITLDAAILLDPEDIDAWVKAMNHLATHEEERKRLSNAAKDRAQCFDWNKNAQSLLQLYEEAADTPKRSAL